MHGRTCGERPRTRVIHGAAEVARSIDPIVVLLARTRALRVLDVIAVGRVLALAASRARCRAGGTESGRVEEEGALQVVEVVGVLVLTRCRGGGRRRSASEVVAHDMAEIVVDPGARLAAGGRRRIPAVLSRVLIAVGAGGITLIQLPDPTDAVDSTEALTPASAIHGCVGSVCRIGETRLSGASVRHRGLLAPLYNDLLVV